MLERAEEVQSRWADYIERLAGGDRQALGSLYDESVPFVWGLVRRIVPDHADAEEVTLDVYAQVWRTAGSFDPDRGSPWAWLTTLARSRAIDRFRQRAAHWRALAPLEDAANTPDRRASDPEQSASSAERRRLVYRVLAELPGEQRTTIELTYFAGLTHRELAAALNVPLGTAKTRTRLARLKLRDRLGGLDLL